MLAFPPYVRHSRPGLHPALRWSLLTHAHKRLSKISLPLKAGVLLAVPRKTGATTAGTAAAAVAAVAGLMVLTTEVAVGQLVVLPAAAVMEPLVVATAVVPGVAVAGPVVVAAMAPIVAVAEPITIAAAVMESAVAVVGSEAAAASSWPTSSALSQAVAT